MFTGSSKSPPAKTPQPERLDEVYSALRRGLQSYLQVHQLELDSLGQQTRENKRNGRLGSLYELDKQVKAIERFMRRLEFHLSKVEELYDAYCIQRRLRDGASKMVAAFNSATGSREARESLSEANKGYREYTEHMCSLESELESQMGEFHIKMKGLAGFARLCAGDQYEVLMRYGRQRWRLRGRVEISNKQVWDSEEYIFLPLVTELLSIKVTELKSLANHVVVGTVSCEMLDLFSPLPQTLAVDINDLGTVKLNLEVTWSPFDKDDQTSSTSTVSKRLLSNQSPPDTPSMREQVFYSLLKRQGEVENGTVWSNSSESSDDSSSPALGHHHAQRLPASHTLLSTATPLLLTTQPSSTSTPSLSSNQEEEEDPDAAEGFCQIDSGKDSVPNGHLRSSASDSHAGELSRDWTATSVTLVQSAGLSETSQRLSGSYTDVSSSRRSVAEGPGALNVPEECVLAPEPKDGVRQVSTQQDETSETRTEEKTTKFETNGEKFGEEPSSQDLGQRYHSIQELKQPDDPFSDGCQSSFRLSQEVETALESFDFLNCSDLDDEEEDVEQEDKVDEEGEHGKDQHKVEEEERGQGTEGQTMYTDGSEDDEEEEAGLEILMEAPEGFRNSDEDCDSQSQGSSTESLQDLSGIRKEEEEDEDEATEEHEEETSSDQADRPATPTNRATNPL